MSDCEDQRTQPKRILSWALIGFTPFLLVVLLVTPFLSNLTREKYVAIALVTAYLIASIIADPVLNIWFGRNQVNGVLDQSKVTGVRNDASTSPETKSSD